MAGGFFFIVALSIGLYFLPSIVGREKRNIGAIFTLNLLLGLDVGRAGWWRSYGR